MSDSAAERRADPRIATEFQLHGTSSQDGVVARMVASNLSLGGLYCTSTTDFPEMTRLAVRLLLPKGGETEGEAESIDVTAVVVRRSEVPSSNGAKRFELALFFTEIEDEVKESLRRYLRR